MKLAPTIAGLGEAVFVTERFALAAPGTISDTPVLCCRLPFTPPIAIG